MEKQSNNATNKQEVVKLNKELCKVVFNQIQEGRLASAKEMPVFIELCWVLDIFTFDEIAKIFDDFLSPKYYAMDEETYTDACEDKEFKSIFPTLEAFNATKKKIIINQIRVRLTERAASTLCELV